MLPSTLRQDAISPREAFTGVKVDYDRDIKYGFLDYVQTLTPNITAKNSTSVARTEGCLFLLNQKDGSASFLSLNSLKVVIRDHGTVIPMPDAVISRIKEMSAQQKRVLSKDPMFTFGSHMMQVSDEVFDDYVYDITVNDPPLHVPPTAAERAANKTSSDAIIEDLTSGETVEDLAASDLMTSDASAAQSHDRGEVVKADSLLDTSITEVSAELPEVPVESTEVPTHVEQEDNQDILQDIENIVEKVEPVSHQYNTRFKASRSEQVSHLSVKDAIETHGLEATELAVTNEMFQMLGKDVIEPVLYQDLNQEERAAIIPSFTFMKAKFTSTGDFDKLKARWTASGDKQDRTLYEDVSSPTVCVQALHSVAAIAAHEHREVVTVDVVGAYLNAEMTENKVFLRVNKMSTEVLVKLDPKLEKFVNPKTGTMIVKLKRALYGCIESGKQWYEHLRGSLEKMGFVRNPYEECTFNKQGAGGHQCTICVYVDDLFITCLDHDVIEEVLSDLKEVYKDLKIKRGLVHSYLGMTFDYSIPGEVKVTMENYVDELLKFCEIREDASSTVPAAPYLFNIRDDVQLLDKKHKDLYHTVVAKLLYLSKRVRLDILLANSVFCTRVKEPTIDDQNKLIKALEYLNCTKHLGKIMRPKAGEPLVVEVHVDSSHGVHTADGRGQAGGVIGFKGECVLAAETSKHSIAAKSSAESELISVSDKLSPGIWQLNFMIGQGYVDIKPLILFQDNTSTIAMMLKGKSTSKRTRHINIRYFFVKDRIEVTKEVEVQYLPTDEMVADILTKPLQGEKFRYLRKKLLNDE
jgi:hypothetical protein